MTMLDRLRALFAAAQPKPPPGGSVVLQDAIEKCRESRAALWEVMERPEPGGPTRNALGNAIAGRRAEGE